MTQNTPNYKYSVFSQELESSSIDTRLDQRLQSSGTDLVLSWFKQLLHLMKEMQDNAG